MTGLTRPQKFKNRHKRRSWQVTTVAMTVMACTVFSQGVSAAVYSGTNAYGIRWYSDTPPAKGVSYDVIPSTDSNAVSEIASEPVSAPVKNEMSSPPPKKKSTKRTRKSSAKKPSKPRTTPSPKRLTPAVSSNRTPRAPRRRVSSLQARQAASLKRRCQRYDDALRKIHAELRAGYRAAQGRKLRQRRRDLQARQFAECPLR